ncbi:hypothetical protein, partial [Mucilaginibacter humi]|uniref:hypothetical protein n=1 Tax=Mucilaginibacter humi TaxID=2732510 RepID=UPI00158585EA
MSPTLTTVPAVFGVNVRASFLIVNLSGMIAVIESPAIVQVTSVVILPALFLASILTDVNPASSFVVPGVSAPLPVLPFYNPIRLRLLKKLIANIFLSLINS